MKMVTKEQLIKFELGFWALVAAEYPECVTGDSDPLLDAALCRSMERAANAWIQGDETPMRDKRLSELMERG